MTSLTSTDELIQIDLPFDQGKRTRKVLAYVVRQSKASTKLVLDDSKTPPLFRTFIGSELPPIYAPVRAGKLSEFLAKNPDATAEVLNAGGVQYGNLTIARAVKIMIESGIKAPEALQKALNISHAVLQLDAELEQMTSDAIKSI